MTSFKQFFTEVSKKDVMGGLSNVNSYLKNKQINDVLKEVLMTYSGLEYEENEPIKNLVNTLYKAAVAYIQDMSNIEFPDDGMVQRTMKFMINDDIFRNEQKRDEFASLITLDEVMDVIKKQLQQNLTTNENEKL